MIRRISAAALAIALLLGAAGCASTGGSKEPFARNAAGSRKARMHHYLFAHRLVPQFFFRNTDEFFLRLRDEPMEEIARVWTQTGQLVKEPERLSAEGLAADYRSADGLRMVTVTLPPAEVSPEALFIVMAIRGRERFYLTYEKAAPLLDLKSVGILCGWDSEGNHLNYGIGGEATREAFDTIVANFFRDGAPAPAAVTPVRAK